MTKKLFALLVVFMALYSTEPYTVKAAVNNLDSNTIDNSIDVSIRYTYSQTSLGVYTTAEVMLATNKIPLNVYEVELISSEKESYITDVVLHENLCKPELTIKNEIDNQSHSAYAACGTYIPFVTDGEFNAIVTVHTFSALGTKPVLTLGENTGFYIHDGLGTNADFKLVN